MFHIIISTLYLPFTFVFGLYIPYSGNFSVDHFSVFDCMQIAPNCYYIVEDLLFFPSDAIAYASCLQLMMQPQGKWVQRLDKTNTGVTVVARRVSRKLSVSKGRLWNPTMYWTAMLICKGRELQTCSTITFSTSLGLSPTHAAPAPFTRPLCCLRARSSASGLVTSALLVNN